VAAEIRVTGVRELGTAFKKVDREFGKALQRRFKGLASQLVSTISGRIPGSAGSALRPQATQRGFGIAFPGGEAQGPMDFYPWLDFGGSTGKGHQVGVPWSGSVKREQVPGGRYIYPTIADNREEIGDQAAEALQDVARDAGFETHG